MLHLWNRESLGVHARLQGHKDSLQELMFFHVDMGKFFSVIDGLQKGMDIHGKI